MRRTGNLFVVSAPSGAGKSTLVEAVLGRLRDRYLIERFVTYTSRQVRAGEVEGRDFYYLSEADFVQKIGEGFFLEWTDGLGHYYGTQRLIIDDLERGRSGILVLDRSGAAKVSQHIPEAVLIWIKVSSMEALRERLLRRGTETEEQVEKRLARAAREVAEEQEKKMYQFHITNDFFDQALGELEDIILSKLVARSALLKTTS